MGQHRTPDAKPPTEALLRWLAQVPYNSIRRVERAFDDVQREDGKMLRGLMVAEDLCLTRQREFFLVTHDNEKAIAKQITFDEVVAKYSLDDLQTEYRGAQERWKSSNRKKTA